MSPDAGAGSPPLSPPPSKPLLLSAASWKRLSGGTAAASSVGDAAGRPALRPLPPLLLSRPSGLAVPPLAHPSLQPCVRPAHFTSPNAEVASAACDAAAGAGAASAAPAAGRRLPGCRPRGSHDGRCRTSAEAPPLLLLPLLVMPGPAVDGGWASRLARPPKAELILRRPATSADWLSCRDVRSRPPLLLLLLLPAARSSRAMPAAPRSPLGRGLWNLAWAALSTRTSAERRRRSWTLAGLRCRLLRQQAVQS